MVGVMAGGRGDGTGGAWQGGGKEGGRRKEG